MASGVKKLSSVFDVDESALAMLLMALMILTPFSESINQIGLETSDALRRSRRRDASLLIASILQHL